MKNLIFSFWKGDNKEFLEHVHASGGRVVDVWSHYEDEVSIEVLVPDAADMSKFAEFEDK